MLCIFCFVLPYYFYLWSVISGLLPSVYNVGKMFYIGTTPWELRAVTLELLCGTWGARAAVCLHGFTSVYTQILYTTVQPYTTETYTIRDSTPQYSHVHYCNIHYSCTIRYTAVMYTIHVHKGILQYCHENYWSIH